MPSTLPRLLQSNLCAIALCLFTFTTGCAPEDERELAPRLTGSGDVACEGCSESDEDPAAEAPAPPPPVCEEGEQRKCKVQYPTQGKVTSCFEGVSVCIDGAWSACGAAS
jgi:hypothetical protein